MHLEICTKIGFIISLKIQLEVRSCYNCVLMWLLVLVSVLTATLLPHSDAHLNPHC